MANVKIISSQRTRLGPLQLYPNVKTDVDADKFRELLAADGGHGRTLMASGVIRVLLADGVSPRPAIDGALADASQEIERLRRELATAEAKAGHVASDHAEELERIQRESDRIDGERQRELDERAKSIASLEARVAELEKAPGATPSGEVAALVGLNADELKSKLAEISDPKFLFSVYEAESSGKNRSTVLRAIETREEELTKAAKG